jgi:hypothetical protein
MWIRSRHHRMRVLWSVWPVLFRRAARRHGGDVPGVDGF